MAERTRREMLKLTAGAAVALLGPGVVVAPGETAPLFFTPEQFRLVDELTEMIIPADQHSPGARAAQVAAYIDARLAESFEAGPKQLWRDGLKRVDALSVEMHGRTFLQAAPEQRVALLTRISSAGAPPTAEEIFFRELKERAARAYYTSKIGIHTEMEYQGNKFLDEFVGYDAKPAARREGA